MGVQTQPLSTQAYFLSDTPCCACTSAGCRQVCVRACVCVRLRAFACVCVRLRASVRACMHLQASVYPRKTTTAQHTEPTRALTWTTERL
eukprot:1151795-Rhodomonas_salina.2